MPNIVKDINQEVAVQISNGSMQCHVQGHNGKDFYWIESATQPTVQAVKVGAKNNELSAPQGWVIWAISADTHATVTINTPSGA